MKRYYEAYDLRYRQVHEQGLVWFGEGPTAIVKDMLERRCPKDAPVLEIGCGEGRDAAGLLEDGWDLLATDVSAEAVAFCRERFPRWRERFRVLDCLKDGMAERFGFIYAVAVLHMLVLDEDRQGMLRFIREHLREKGEALIVVMGDGRTERRTDAEHAFDLQERCHEQSGQRMQLAATSCCMVTWDAFLEELRRAELEVIEYGDTAWADAPAAMYALVRSGADGTADV